VSACAQEATANVHIEGRIFSAADSTAVVYMNVFDLRSHRGTLSGNDGSFAVLAAIGDTLKISGVGYDDAYIYVTGQTVNDKVTIYLQPSNYQLQQVTVNSFNKDEFRRKFKEMEIPEDQVVLNLPPNPTHQDQYAEAPKPKISGFSFGWSPYLEKIRKQNAQLRNWQKKEDYNAFIDKKYNKGVVKRVTGLPEEQLEAFMKYCNMPDEFVAGAQDYDIAVAIKDCYLAFLEVKAK
jgi:hypothetical protein